MNGTLLKRKKHIGIKELLALIKNFKPIWGKKVFSSDNRQHICDVVNRQERGLVLQLITAGHNCMGNISSDLNDLKGSVFYHS